MKLNFKIHAKRLGYILGIAVASLAMGASLRFVKAWSEPTQSAPNGNVGAPITTGADAQTKSGPFSSSKIEAPNNGQGNAYLTTQTGSLPGYAGSNYPTLKSDSSYLYLSSGGSYNGWIGSGGIAAPIFYDMNNTGYYVDPNSASQVNTIYANNWFRSQGDSGLYFQDHGGGLNMVDGTWIRTYGVGNFYAFGESQATTVRANSQLCIGGDCRSSWPSGLQLDTWQGNHYFASDGREYATILYDTNNSGYYVDPASTSVLNSICAGGTCAGGYFTNDGTYLRAEGNFRTTGTFYNDGNSYANDFYIRSIGKWASTLGGIPAGMDFVKFGHLGVLLDKNVTVSCNDYNNGGNGVNYYARNNGGTIQVRMQWDYNFDTGWITANSYSISGIQGVYDFAVTATPNGVGGSGGIYGWQIGNGSCGASW